MLLIEKTLLKMVNEYHIIIIEIFIDLLNIKQIYLISID